MFRSRAFAVTVVAAVALAGCGSGGHHTASAASSSGSPDARRVASLYRQLAQCIRTHGVPDFPDPVQNPSTGDWALPDGTKKPPQSALNACRSIGAQLPQKGDNNPVSAADMAKLRQFAQCMRQHGLPDWPDPNSSGAFPLPSRLRQAGKSGIRPQLQACRQYSTQHGFRIAEPDGGNG